MPTYKKLFVTIKATLKCNLGCLYCYGRDNHSIAREMDDEEIHKALLFILEYAKLKGVNNITLCWHGGEPFLLAKRMPALLDYARNLFNSEKIECSFVTQTNAVLLTPANYDLIKKYFDNSVGVSLDLYSNFRTFPNGQQSSDIVINNIDKAIESDIKLSCINLITQHNLHRIKDIYQFYKERNMTVRLARVFPIDKEYNPSDAMYVTAEEFAGAMNEYFDLWANDPEPALNYDIIHLIGDLLLGRASICFREYNCTERYMALCPGGDIYSCAEFDVPESVIGNFLKQSPQTFIASDARQLLFKKAPIPEKCHTCKFETICYGACLRERFMLKYPFRCETNKLHWDHIVEWLENKGCSLFMLKGKSKEEIVDVMTKLFNRE